MLLMSPGEASLSIGAACAGSCPEQEDPGLVQILALLTPKVEASLNVGTLTRGDFTDIFDLPRMPAYVEYERRSISLRLTNGFLTADPTDLVITDYAGRELDDTTYPGIEIRVRRDLGTIELDKWIYGKYTVEYVAGFEPEDPPSPAPAGYNADRRVLQGIPDWMKAIVVQYLTQWYRTTVITPKLPKDASLEFVANMIYRSIQASVYGVYQRPRAVHIWGIPQ